MDSCRKLSYGHPTLSPSTFTVCCQHGVCYSYEVMALCESPKIPFQFFSLAFPNHLVWLSMIMHANCTSTAWIENLGTSKTHFLVDHFHWRGHTGCSSGYNLDPCGEPILKTLNSQINEQANADVQKIQGQLAYMTPANFQFHLSLFISIKNCIIIHAMDLSQLCVSWYCIHCACCIICYYIKKGTRSGRDIYQIWNHSERKSPKLGRICKKKISTYILLKTRGRKEPNPV